MTGIYLISGVQGQGCYVGLTVDTDKRWNEHRWDLDGQRHKNQHLQNAWNLHGSDAYAFVVVESPVAGDLPAREIYWHDRLKDEGVNLYNICPPGSATWLGLHHSDESKAKIRAARANQVMPVGRKRSEETREKLRVAARARMTPEHHAKMLAARSGRRKPLSEETKRKISEARKGKPLSAEHRAKISGGIQRFLAGESNG